MVIMGIILVLIGILVPTMRQVRQAGEKARTLASMGAIQTGLAQYYSDFRMYPPSGGAYGGVAGGRGAAMLAQGLMGYLDSGADGAGPANGDPTYGFRIRKPNAAMGGGGQVFGPYVSADWNTFQGSGTTRYFVDSWGNELLYYRSTRAAVGAPTAAPTQVFGSGGGTNANYYFDSGDCASTKTPWSSAGSPTGAPAGFFVLIGASSNSLSSTSGAVTGADSYLLISAGLDERYFTADDIVVGK
jgi:hypothetical protein